MKGFLGTGGWAWWVILFEISLAGLAWVLGWLLGQPALATLRWDPLDLLVGIGGSLPLLLLFFLLLRWPIGPLARIEQFMDEVLRPLFAPCTFLELALLSLAAGVGEETLFRAVLQAALGNWFGVWAGLIVASMLFGLVHAITPAYVVIAALIGVYLGYLWMANGNLLTVVTTHAVYDFVALVCIVRYRSSHHFGPGPRCEEVPF